MSKKGKHLKDKDSKINYKIIIIICSTICILLLGIGICIWTVNYKKNMDMAQTEQNQVSEESLETANLEKEVIEETLDTKMEQLITEIRATNNLNENNFYFFYYNIEEKKYYFYNENTYFTAASTIKVPVSMLYYDKIAVGELTEADTLLYSRDDYEAGGGRTAIDYKAGQKVPISYLLEQTIVNSDNTALNILMSGIGYRKCKEELTKYTDIELIEDFYTSNVANCLYYYDVLQYLYQNTDRYSELIEYMKQSSGGVYLKEKLSQYDVSHKYGSYNGYVHDYGIIYGKNTYLVGVFTKGIEGASTLIADIGKQVVDCAEKEEVEETNIDNEIRNVIN